MRQTVDALVTNNVFSLSLHLIITLDVDFKDKTNFYSRVLVCFSIVSQQSCARDA